MTDGVVLNSMSGGDTVAADDISGTKHQLVKLEYGTDGTATLVSASNPLPVQVTAGDPLAVTQTSPTPHPLAGTPPVSQVVVATAAKYCGVTVRETTGTTSATVVLYDHASAASGTVLATISLLPAESRDDNIIPGRTAANGIYAAITGTVQGSVMLGS